MKYTLEKQKEILGTSLGTENMKSTTMSGKRICMISENKTFPYLWISLFPFPHYPSHHRKWTLLEKYILIIPDHRKIIFWKWLFSMLAREIQFEGMFSISLHACDFISQLVAHNGRPHSCYDHALWVRNRLSRTDCPRQIVTTEGWVRRHAVATNRKPAAAGGPTFRVQQNRSTTW